MKLSLISPEGTHFQNEVTGFVYDSRTGQKTVLADQIETLSFFNFSQLSILAEQDAWRYYIADGYVLVKENETKIVAKIVSESEAATRQQYESLTKNMIREEMK